MMESEPQNIEVSENNKGQDIEYFFERREEMRNDFLEIIDASSLSDEDKNLFKKVVEDFIEEVIDRATGPGRFDDQIYDICRRFVTDVMNIDGTKMGEKKATFEAIRDHMYNKFRKERVGY